MSIIYIYKTDNVNAYSYKSYDEVIELLKSPIDSVIHTHCLEFFSFEYLDVCSNVYLEMYNQHQENVIINIRDLLNNKYLEIGREIRRGHNIHKMLLAGVFDCIRGNDMFDEDKQII